METLYKVFVSIIPPVVGILVYVFIESKRKARTKTMPVQNGETLLDDVSYIQEIKHLHGAVGIAFWKQYDVLLAAQHYGWETMVDWAAYMESADIDKIDSIAVADLNDDTGIELAHVYNLNKVGLKNFERLVEEHGIPASCPAPGESLANTSRPSKSITAMPTSAKGTGQKVCGYSSATTDYRPPCTRTKAGQ